MSLESDADRPRGPRRRLLDDPRDIRALAHPLRLELSSIVGRAGRITAAAAARELGISQALASHHLRQLAKYGFVEQVDGADNRERPWRLVHTSTSYEATDDPVRTAAVSVLEQVVAERAVGQLIDWQERAASWGRRWRENAGIGRSMVYLTEDEFVEVSARLQAVLAELIEQRPLDDLDSRPPGSVGVEFTYIVTPQEPTAGG